MTLTPTVPYGTEAHISGTPRFFLPGTFTDIRDVIVSGTPPDRTPAKDIVPEPDATPESSPTPEEAPIAEVPVAKPVDDVLAPVDDTSVEEDTTPAEDIPTENVSEEVKPVKKTRKTKNKE